MGSKIIPDVKVPPSAVDLALARIEQARAVCATIDITLSDRLVEPEHGGLTDNVLQRLAWAADDLLESAHQAVIEQSKKEDV
jgi:hypothetical protein